MAGACTMTPPLLSSTTTPSDSRVDATCRGVHPVQGLLLLPKKRKSPSKSCKEYLGTSPCPAKCLLPDWETNPDASAAPSRFSDKTAPIRFLRPRHSQQNPFAESDQQLASCRYFCPLDDQHDDDEPISSVLRPRVVRPRLGPFTRTELGESQES